VQHIRATAEVLPSAGGFTRNATFRRRRQPVGDD